MSDKKAFVAYLDDRDKSVEGFFEIQDQNQSFLKIRSGKNSITIPWHRVKKIKESTR